MSAYTVSSIGELSQLKDLKSPLHTNITVNLLTAAGHTAVRFDPHGMDILNMTINEIGEVAFRIFTERLTQNVK